MIKKKRQQHNTAGFRTAKNSGYTPLKRRIAADVTAQCTKTEKRVDNLLLKDKKE